MSYERVAYQREVEHNLYPLEYPIDDLLEFYFIELDKYGVDKSMQHSNNLAL